jgi:hypothetical protein
MKKLLILSTLCTAWAAPLNSIFFPIWGQGGGDSLRYSQETGTLEKQRFIDRYDYVFMTKEPTKGLFKIYLHSSAIPKLGLRGPSQEITDGLPYRVFYSLGYEHKITHTISIDLNVTGGYYTHSVWGNHFGTIELRWFYDMKSRMRKELQVSNLSGSYVGLRYGKMLNLSDNRLLKIAELPFYGNRSGDFYQANHFVLKWGSQKRFFQRGFADFSLNFGLTDYHSSRITNSTFFPNSFREWVLFTDTKVGLGFETFKTKKTRIKANLCDVWRCFEEQKHLWKVNLTSPIIISNNHLFLSLPIEFEQKIRQSSWSLNTGLTTNFGQANRSYIGTYGTAYKAFYTQVHIQPRYYYNLKKRIRKGLSANNLSGNYFTIIGNQSFNFLDLSHKPSNPSYRQKGWNNQRSFAVAWGLQRRLFNKGFLDLHLGAAYKERSTMRNQPIFEPYSSFKLGYILNN